MTSAEPYLSFVVASRNDDHGGGLLRRMQVFVDGLLNQCRRHDLPAELIIVEWNPPADRPGLAEALRWPDDAGPCQVRIIAVPEALHRRLRHSGQLPLFQMIAKNVGIRRARGQFVLATNIDILFSDELMAHFAARRLAPRRLYRIDRLDAEAGVPLPAPVEEQLAYCASHLLRRNAVEGTFQVTPTGAECLSVPDIVSPHLGIRPGRGWYAPETANGETFRWAAADAILHVDQRPDLPRLLCLEVEPGPGVGYQPFELEVRSATDEIVARGTVRKRELVAFAVPENAGPAARYVLRAARGGRPTANDWRILNFRVYDVQRVEDWDTPAAGQLQTRPVPAARRAVLAEGDIAAPELGVAFGPGWHPVEAGGGQRYRWAGNDAALVVTATDGDALTLAVEPGPGVGYQPFDLQVRDEQGRTLGSCRVAGTSLATIPLPVPARQPRVVTLHVDQGGQPAPNDSRILNFRVFGPIRRGRARVPLSRALLLRQLTQCVPPWLKNAVKRVVRRRAHGNVTMPAPIAAPTAPAASAEPISPVPLHLNASGDFTLLDRQSWLDLKGYPEFEMYSLHIDSLFCYMAHHAGAAEEVLSEPMRIYHIEHSTGSGWTPEGAGQLFQRLQAKRIPIIEIGELLQWATQMRRQNAPLVFNGDAWGIGKQSLSEQVITPSRRSDQAGAVAALSALWAKPLKVLRSKWHEIPVAAERRSTHELQALSDAKLNELWWQAHQQQTSSSGTRAWYHTHYRDIFRGKRVLDVGSGFGIDALSFARAGAQVTCLDVTESNLNILKRLARHQRLSGITVHYLDNLQSLAGLDTEFDVIWCNGSMHHTPFGILKEECRALLQHLKPQGRWIQLAYPKVRWERDGCLPFVSWGDYTDGGAPWTEWYDLNKLLALLAPDRFEVILEIEFHNSDFNWFDLQRVK